MYPRNTWQAKALEHISVAQEVLYATYIYDDPYFQATFLERLGGRGRFQLHLLVDEQASREGTCQRQHGRLLALKTAGANISTAKGPHGTGIMHMKLLIIDKKMVFHGSANCTYGSRSHWEMTTAITGPPVADFLKYFGEVPRKALRG